LQKSLFFAETRFFSETLLNLLPRKKTKHLLLPQMAETLKRKFWSISRRVGFVLVVVFTANDSNAWLAKSQNKPESFCHSPTIVVRPMLHKFCANFISHIFNKKCHVTRPDATRPDTSRFWNSSSFFQSHSTLPRKWIIWFYTRGLSMRDVPFEAHPACNPFSLEWRCCHSTFHPPPPSSRYFRFPPTPAPIKFPPTFQVSNQMLVKQIAKQHRQNVSAFMSSDSTCSFKT